MADGRRREAWNHTAHLLALIYNANRGTKQKALSPRDFHPLADPAAVTPRSPPVPKQKDLSILRQVFCRQGTPHAPRAGAALPTSNQQPATSN